ncbi:MAG TPA: acetylxylan esterase, partial [Terriglobales bacterium]
MAAKLKSKHLHFSAVFTLLLLTGIIHAQAPPANYDESKVGTYTLPDPLVFNNGAPVRTPRDWAKRRQEILELFRTNVYGRSPQPPKNIRFKVFDLDRHALGGKAIRKQITIYFSAKDDGPKEDVLLYLPSTARKPVPVILSLNFSGNQSVTSDPGVRLGTIWEPKTHVRRQATEDSRGRDHGFDVEKTLAHGYGFATIYYQDIEPDFDGGYRFGIRPLFFKAGQTEAAPDQWGAIGAWAYGLSRAMDYLEKEHAIDARRVAVMGHSRLGKTVLWAGAQDPRFAMVLSNCPGEGGASLARRNYGETIASLVARFGYQFAGNLKQYADHVDKLPVDTHELIALIAP